jgi:hypothetical protein
MYWAASSMAGFIPFSFARIPTERRNLIKRLPWATQFIDTLVIGATKLVGNAHVVHSIPHVSALPMNTPAFAPSTTPSPTGEVIWADPASPARSRPTRQLA